MARAPQSNFIDVNGVRLHYLMAGKGDPVVLLHGFAETSHMWLLPEVGLDQESHGAGHPCAGAKPRLPTYSPSATISG